MGYKARHRTPQSKAHTGKGKRHGKGKWQGYRYKARAQAGRQHKAYRQEPVPVPRSGVKGKAGNKGKGMGLHGRHKVYKNHKGKAIYKGSKATRMGTGKARTSTAVCYIQEQGAGQLGRGQV